MIKFETYLCHVKGFESIQTLSEIDVVVFNPSKILYHKDQQVTYMVQDSIIDLNPSLSEYNTDYCMPNQVAIKRLKECLGAFKLFIPNQSSIAKEEILRFADKLNIDFYAIKSQHEKESFTYFRFTARRRIESVIMTGFTENQVGYDKRIY